MIFLRRQLRTGRRSGSSSSLAPSPASILGSGLLVDLDADKGVGLVSGAVDTWADQSGAGRNMAAPAAAQRPAVVAGPGAHSAIDFIASANAERLANTSFSGITTASTWRQYIIAFIDAFAASGGCLADLSVGASSNSHSQYHSFNATAHNLRIVNTGAAIQDLNTPPNFFTTGSWQLYSAEVTTTTLAVYQGSGAALKSAARGAATFNAAPTRLTLAAAADASESLDGKIARYLLCSPAPSAAQHAQILQYLREQYPTLGL